MDGVPSYEQRLRNPGLSVIDFEFVSLHPEAKFAIWERYCIDSFFRMKIREQMLLDPIFKKRFRDAFRSFLDQELRKGR